MTEYYPRKICPKTGKVIERDIIQRNEPECITCWWYKDLACHFTPNKTEEGYKQERLAQILEEATA